MVVNFEKYLLIRINLFFFYKKPKGKIKPKRNRRHTNITWCIRARGDTSWSGRQDSNILCIAVVAFTTLNIAIQEDPGSMMSEGGSEMCTGCCFV